MKNLKPQHCKISNENMSKGQIMEIHGMVTCHPILTGFLFLLMIQNIQPELANLTPCPDLYPHFIGYIIVLVARSLDTIIL